jgi:hypothetical protein
MSGDHDNTFGVEQNIRTCQLIDLKGWANNISPNVFEEIYRELSTRRDVTLDRPFGIGSSVGGLDFLERVLNGWEEYCQNRNIVDGNNKQCSG